MYQKTFALTVRALRVDTRQLSPHLMRGGLGLFVLMFLFTTQQEFSAQAPGKTLFSWIIYTNAVFASFVVPMLFASAITEEKEERMLPLLQIAGVSPLTILIGKSIPRMLSLLLIFIIQLPFSMLAITLGGISLNQILACYAGVAAYMIFLGFLALWCSVVFRLTANAIGLAGFLVLGYHFAPTVLYGIFAAFSSDPWWGATAQAGIQFLGTFWPTNLFYRLSIILSSGYNEGLWSWQIGTNLLLGLFFFLLSWVSFQHFNRETDFASVPKKSRIQTSRRRRPWDRALVWKEFYFAAGGTFYLVTKLFLYGCILLLVAGASAGWNWQQINLNDTASIAAAIMCFVFLPLETVLTVARTFYPEIRDKTLSSLTMLPISTRRLAYSKLAGGLLGLIPVLVYLSLCVLVQPKYLFEILSEIGQNPFEALLVTANVVANILFFLHLVTWLSLRMNSWWAIFVAWLIHYVGFTALIMCFTIVAMGFTINPPEGAGYVLAALAALFVGALVVLLHIQIGEQLRHKAAEM